MDPTTTFVLAIVATVVSVLSLVASGGALYQSSYFHPKPYMVFSVRRDKPIYEKAPTFLLAITNMGTAAARDLHLTLNNEGIGNFEKLFDLIVLDPSMPIETRISMVTGESFHRFPRDGIGGKVEPEGESKDMTMVFTVTWSQAPNFRKKQSQSFTVNVLDSNVLGGPLPKPYRGGRVRKVR